MSQGPHLKAITDILLDTFIKYPDYRLKPTEFRKKLLERMKEKGKDKNFPPDWPSRAAVSKWLKEYRKKDEERSSESKGIDEPWTFGSLAKYPISPEAIPLVISIYEKCAGESGYSERWMPSIREMLWVGRLHKIIEHYKIKHKEHVLPDVRDEILSRVLHKEKWPDELGENPSNLELAEAWGLKGKEIPLEDIVLEWASAFATCEELSEIEGEPFDSTEYQLDGDLLRNVYEYYGERRQNFIEQIEEDYEVDVDKLIELNLSLGEIERAAWRYADSKFQCRIFYVPKTEEDILRELEELHHAVKGSWTGGLVILEPNKDVPDKLLRKLEQYEVNISKEAQNEGTHNQKS